jgi:site-specific recombinase XerD
MLEQAIRDYLGWMASEGYSPKTCEGYRRLLNNFLLFISHKNIAWDDIFTLDTLKAFQQERSLKYVPAVRGLSRYLFEQKRISQPIQKQRVPLPEIYEDYLLSYENSREVHHSQIAKIRRLLSAFSDFLERSEITLPTITIEQIDSFLAHVTVNLAPGTCRAYRSFLRGFLKYLYRERRMLKRHLAPLVVGAPLFAQGKPPKFLRPQEVQRLFDNLKLSTPTDIRTYAMVHLAYSLGLRPKEISSITLDDISFKKNS